MSEKYWCLEVGEPAPISLQQGRLQCSWGCINCTGWVRDINRPQQGYVQVRALDEKEADAQGLSLQGRKFDSTIRRIHMFWTEDGTARSGKQKSGPSVSPLI